MEYLDKIADLELDNIPVKTKLCWLTLISSSLLIAFSLAILFFGGFILYDNNEFILSNNIDKVTSPIYSTPFVITFMFMGALVFILEWIDRSRQPTYLSYFELPIKFLDVKKYKNAVSMTLLDNLFTYHQDIEKISELDKIIIEAGLNEDKNKCIYIKPLPYSSLRKK